MLNGVVPSAVLQAAWYAHNAECNFNSQSILELSTIFVSIVHKILLELSAWPFALWVIWCGFAMNNHQFYQGDAG